MPSLKSVTFSANRIIWWHSCTSFHLVGEPITSQHHQDVFQQEIVKRFPLRLRKRLSPTTWPMCPSCVLTVIGSLPRPLFSAPGLFSFQFLIDGFLFCIVGDAAGLRNAVGEHEAVHFREFNLRCIFMDLDVEPRDRRQKLKELFRVLREYVAWAKSYASLKLLSLPGRLIEISLGMILSWRLVIGRMCNFTKLATKIPLARRSRLAVSCGARVGPR